MARKHESWFVRVYRDIHRNVFDFLSRFPPAPPIFRGRPGGNCSFDAERLTTVCRFGNVSALFIVPSLDAGRSITGCRFEFVAVISFPPLSLDAERFRFDRVSFGVISRFTPSPPDVLGVSSFPLVVPLINL